MKNQFKAKQPYKHHHQRLIDEESELQSSSDFLQSMNFMLPEIPIDQDKNKVQHQVIIENTPVFFPHSPYNVQIEYMKNVIQALDKKQNALLESPTGTGKTLSTLCASLAWLKKYRENQNIERGDQTRYLKIIYSSRTHAQLKQVAQELKKTVYQPNVAMLGSRDQYCIRGDLSHMKGIVLNQICKKSIKSNRCMFYQKDQLSGLASTHLKLLHSLEEAKQFGYQNKCCPYYFERERLQYADVIMLPYNYLLDKNFMNIVQIENAIIIFDEAHNVQNTAQDGSSFSISQNDATEAQNDLKRWIEELESPHALVKLEFAQLIFSVREYKSILMTIKMFANFLLEKKIQIQAQPSDYENEKFQIQYGRDIFDIIKKAEDKQTGSIYEKGLYLENLKIYLNHCQDLFKIMGEHSSTQGNHFEAWIKFIENIYDLMQVDEQRQQQFKSVASLENPVNQFKLAFKLDSLHQLSLNMWCLDPSLAFNRLIEKGIYSTILTSGTLAPFQSWACELRVDFPICLQNKHIIDITQNLRVFQNKSFDFSFLQRNNEEQINKLGISLLNLCKVIPNGILVIFSSYSLMNKLRSKWTQSKILLRILEIKACLWEPNQTAEMQNVFEMYKQKANKGAIMFAVQRGKVAEGIDFSDELCRAVFLIGVPYPPKTDQKLIQKMAYLDQLFSDPEFQTQKRLKSSEWYTQQAIRATNQALGRVIRHVNDYGVVFLCDKRFEYGDVSRGLSEWVKPAVQPWLNDDDIIQKTKEFFKRNPSNNIQQQQQCGVNQVEKQREGQQSQSSHLINFQNRNIPVLSNQTQSQRKQPIQLKQALIKSSSATKQQAPQTKPQQEYQQLNRLIAFSQQKSLNFQRKQSQSESLDDSNDEESQLSNENCENLLDSSNQESLSPSEMLESQNDPNEDLQSPTPEDSYDEQPSSDNLNDSDEWQSKKKKRYNEQYQK